MGKRAIDEGQSASGERQAKRAKRPNGDGVIRQRPNGLWEAAITMPDGKRKSFYGKAMSEAMKKRDDAKRDLAEGRPLPQGRLRFGAYLDEWLETVVQPTVRPYTHQSYSMLVKKHITPELGNIKLVDLNAQHIRKLLNDKHKGGLSARTVQYIHAVIRRALRQAEADDLVRRNVARSVTPPRVPKAEVHPLTLGEVKKLLAVVHDDRLAALYTVAIALGLRQGEGLGLRWSDIDFETATLTVRTSLQWHDKKPQLAEPKTAKSRRTVKLPDVCIQALHAHRGQQSLEHAEVGDAWQNTENLVFTQEDGSPLTRSMVTHAFWRILKSAGIPKRRFHDLRHTCATLLLAQGVPLKVIQEQLGHSLLSTTADIYTTVLPVLMTDAADKMDAILKAP